MNARRLFEDGSCACGAKGNLSPDNARIARDVLRLRPGNEVQLLDGFGNVKVARIESLTKKEVSVVVLSQRHEPKPAPELHLIQGLPKGDKASEIVQRAVEWGAAKIVFVASEHAVPKKSATPDRWSRVAVEAMRQSGNPYLPSIEGPVPLEEALKGGAADVRLLFDEVEGEPFERQENVSSVSVAVGPEGGWSEAEKATFLSNGFRRIHVGPYVLRTETAAVGAVAVCRALYGNLFL